MNSKQTFRLGILFAAILHFIIWLYTKKKSFIRENGRMPFIMNTNINQTIKKYLETVPSNQVLIFSGPYLSGKSTILELISEYLIRNKQFPFIMRADQSITIEDLIDSIKINCLKTIDSLSKLLSSTEIQKCGSLSIFSVNCSQKIDHPHFSAPTTAKFDSIGLSKIYDYMATIANSLLTVDQDPDLFFDLINRIDLVIKPVVLIFGFDHLRKMKTKTGENLGATFYNHSLKRFKKRTQYSEFVPYILEIRDTMMFLRNKKKAFSNNTFIYTYTDQIEDVVKQISHKRSLFTYKEAQYLYENFGGHGGSLSNIFFDTQNKRPIQESVNTLNTKLDILMQKTVKNSTDPVWYQICNSNKNSSKGENRGEIRWSAIWPSGKKLLRPLIKRGILFSDSSKIVKTAHPGVLRYICKVAKKPGWTFKLPPAKKKSSGDKKKIVRTISVSSKQFVDDSESFNASVLINKNGNTTTVNQTELTNQTEMKNQSQLNNETNSTEVVNSTNNTEVVNETNKAEAVISTNNTKIELTNSTESVNETYDKEEKNKDSNQKEL